MDRIEGLARAVIYGDPGAMEDFVAAVRHKVYQYSYLNCGRRDEAEEVAQETLLRVCEHLHELREPEHVRTWLFRIARNICLTRRRHHDFEPCSELSIERVPTHWDELLPGREELPEEAAYHHELRRLLARAIHSLPEPYRSVVMLRDLEDLSVEQTASILDVSENVVKTRLRRARAAMRKRLENMHISVTS